MDSLVDDGFIVLGGPVGTGDRTLHLVQASAAQQIRDRMSGDPWAELDMLRVGSIEPWALWLDGRNRLDGQQQDRGASRPEVSQRGR